MSDKAPQRKIMIIRESPWKSWARDASTFALFSAMIGVGWLLNSEPMQWVGAIVAFTTFLAQFSGFRKQHTFTIAEARAELDRIERAS